MTTRTLSRLLIGVLFVPLACSNGGSSGGGTGGSTGAGTGGSSPPGTGGTGPSGTGGASPPGSGGGGPTGTGGRATGSGGAVVTGSGGAAGSRGTGGSGTGGSGGAGATTGSGGSGTGTGGSAAADQSVLERNKNPSRDGHFLQPTLTKAMAMAMAPDTNFDNAATFTSTVQNGANVAASPVYLDGPNGTGLFFIPTVGGDVVAVKEDGTSQWKTSIGTPATGGIGCSGFATTPPLGILSTPVIDASSKTIYVAGIVGNAQGVTSQIASAIDITTGKVESGWPVDVSGGASFDPKVHNQRGALSLVNGMLYIPYAGYVGDCGSYHGRVVAVDTSKAATAGQWATGDMGGGIWASGGLASDGTSVFAATGNYVPLQTAPATHTDSEEVVRITGTGTKADFFYPANDWSSFDKNDADLGSNNPMVITVPGATPSKLVVAISKGGNGYLLDAGQLHGASTMGGGEKATFSLSSQLSVFGAPASYRTATATYVVMSSSKAAGCPGGGAGNQVMAVRIAPSPLAAAVVWCAPLGTTLTNPIATTTDGSSDAIVWYVSGGKLMGVDGDTGATVYSSSNTCSSVPKWSSPIAVKGRIVVAGNGHFCAWGIPGALSQAEPPPATAKKRRHKRTLASASDGRASRSI
jgi:hypothetical protein